LGDQLEYQNNLAQLQAGVATQSLNDATLLGQQQLNENYNLAETNQQAYDSELPFVLQHAGQQQNSALDANDQTNIFETFLSGGNPGVAAAGVQSSAATAVAGDAQTASIANTITKTAGTVITGLFA
jgi:hypothetical protein